MALSPDGKTLVTGDYEQAVRIWDLKEGRLIREIHADWGMIGSVAISPKDGTLATAADCNSIRLWDLSRLIASPQEDMPEVNSDRDFLRLESAIFHRSEPGWVAVSPDGNRLATMLGTLSRGGNVSVRSLHTLDHITSIESNGIRAPRAMIQFTPDSRSLICSRDTKFEWRNVESGQEEKVLLHGLHAGAFSLAPDGQRLASVHGTDTLMLWDAVSASTDPVNRLPAPGSIMVSVEFSPLGNTVAAGTETGQVFVWENLDGNELRSFVLNHWASNITTLAFSPDAKILASGGAKHVMLWDLGKRKEIKTIEEHTGKVHSVAFSHDGKTLVTAGGSENPFMGEIVLWDMASMTRLVYWRGGHGPIRDVTFSPDGKLITVGPHNETRIWTLHPESREPVTPEAP